MLVILGSPEYKTSNYNRFKQSIFSGQVQVQFVNSGLTDAVKTADLINGADASRSAGQKAAATGGLANEQTLTPARILSGDPFDLVFTRRVNLCASSN